MTLPDLVLAAFLLFCRVGACVMIMPGFSSPRVPIRMRLAAAISITLSIAPLLIERVAPNVDVSSDAAVVLAILRELLTGGTIGVLGRILFAALEALCTAAAMAAGYGNPFGARVDETESVPELASLVMLTATTLFFVTGQHGEVVRALAASYDVLQPGAPSDPRFTLVQVTDMMGRAFPIALQITSPFILYGLIVNFAFGLINRLVPQIPVYFISTPFVIAGGLVLLYAVGSGLLMLFTGAFQSWLIRG